MKYLIIFLLLLSVGASAQLANTKPTLPTGIFTTDNFQTFQGTVWDTTFPTQPSSGTIWKPGNGNPGTCTLGVSPNSCWGAALESALKLAQPGDTIVLQAGATYQATIGKPAPPEYGLGLTNICSTCFTLPAKTSNPLGLWILIESSNMAQLPPADNRVHPSD